MRQVNLETLIRHCQAEAAQQRTNRDEAGACLELFRRALEERHDQAWSAIQQQYRHLILKWVSARAADLSATDVEELSDEAFERFWRTLQTVAVGERFPHVGALLNYLQQCAITAVLDYRRREQRRQRLVERMAQNQGTHAEGMEDTTIDRLLQSEQVAQIRAWIAANVTDPQEQLVLQASFQAAMSPASIAERYPEQFASVQVVRQIKERVLKRIRRALRDQVVFVDTTEDT